MRFPLVLGAWLSNAMGRQCGGDRAGAGEVGMAGFGGKQMLGWSRDGFSFEPASRSRGKEQGERDNLRCDLDE